MSNKIVLITDYLEAEDSLQSHNVFVNQYGEPRHSDSYGTLVDFSALFSWKKKFQVTKEIVDYWTKNKNQQPPLRIVGALLAKKKLKN